MSFHGRQMDLTCRHSGVVVATVFARFPVIADGRPFELIDVIMDSGGVNIARLQSVVVFLLMSSPTDQHRQQP